MVEWIEAENLQRMNKQIKAVRVRNRFATTQRNQKKNQKLKEDANQNENSRGAQLEFF